MPALADAARVSKVEAVARRHHSPIWRRPHLTAAYPSSASRCPRKNVAMEGKPRQHSAAETHGHFATHSTNSNLRQFRHASNKSDNVLPL